MSLAEATPLDDLLHGLAATLSGVRHNDAVMNVGNPREFEIRPSAFREIPDTDHPRKIAFVDGGNGTVAESPKFAISLNRLYSSTFRGRERVGAASPLNIEFLSLITNHVTTSETGDVITRDISLFPRDDSHRKYLPREADVASSMARYTTVSDRRTPASTRILGEWQMARVVAGTLERGDMLVMDGSLTTPDRIEAEYAQELYRAASERGVIVCALAKTSRLLTRGGEPLLDRVRQISGDVEYGRWRISVADKISAHDSGFVMVVKLHPGAAFPFRFEILREQFADMDEVQRDDVLASLAANSDDISFLGYPYGLIDVDRFAQVRNKETYVYRGWLESKTRTGAGLRHIAEHIRSVSAHDYLNGVSG